MSRYETPGYVQPGDILPTVTTETLARLRATYDRLYERDRALPACIDFGSSNSEFFHPSSHRMGGRRTSPDEVNERAARLADVARAAYQETYETATDDDLDALRARLAAWR